MKYWILTTEYPPDYGGGIGTYVFYTARMLSRQNHDVSVFICDQTNLTEDKIVFDNNIRVVKFTPTRTNTNSYLGYNAKISYEYAAVIEEFIKKEGQPDIIESQEYHGIAYYIQQFKLLKYDLFLDIDVLITCHAPSFLCLEYNQVPIYQFPHYWTAYMEKASIRGADILISPSKYFVREAQSRMNWDNLVEHYVGNPIELDQNFYPSTFIPNYVICYGKLSPLKGTFELLRYFKDLWENGLTTALHIIGGTDQYFHPENMTMGDILKRDYKKYISVGLLVLEGPLPPDRAKEKLIKAHVVLLPSIVDNLPYTALEAMSWGKIVLASIQGGQSEIIKDGENGFLFNHKTANDFQRKLLNILQLESEQIKQIGENARKTIHTKFSSTTIYDQKLTLIQEYKKNKSSKKIFPFVENISHSRSSTEKINSKSLSVIIPYYNMGAYIEECLVSVLASEYEEKEIIIVDDGSSENESIEKLAQLESKYSIKVYRKKNEGLSITRNYGASKATGTYIAFLDADDTVEKTYYKKAIKVLDHYDNVFFAGCWVKYFGNSKNYWPTFTPEPPYLLVHNMVNSSALVYKRNAFIESGQNTADLIYGMEDWDSVINLIKDGKPGVILPEALFNYRVRRGSMSSSFTRVKQLYLYSIIANRHKHLFNRYGPEISLLLNANGSGLYFDNPTFEIHNSNRLFVFKISKSLKTKVISIVKRNPYLRILGYKFYKKLKLHK